MTFQPCRPATIKLLPYEGAPFGTGLAFCVVMRRRELGGQSGLQPGADDLHCLAVFRHLLALLGVAESFPQTPPANANRGWRACL